MDKEEWDYEKFIFFYNKIAYNSGGWLYEETGSKQEVKEKYEQSGDSSIQDFAKNLFIFEQLYK
jgi:hypothetical protein